MEDLINHPNHYETGTMECFDVILETQGWVAAMDFCACNALKYIYRHRRKKGHEDMEKAKWYIDKWLELSEQHETENFSDYFIFTGRDKNPCYNE